jgi:predicted DCC family thiol-disulfide oxidoreductase YuxK
MSVINVIYDGQCELCKNSIIWVSKKLEISAVDFHTADLSRFGLTLDQCTREVFVIHESQRYNGANAVSYLLKARGNRIMAGFIAFSGPIGRFTYRWIARNRNSIPVKFLSYLLKR